MSAETKICVNCKKDFLIEPEDFAFYEKIKIPAPTWCPECRQLRRMMFRNFKTFYKRNSDRSFKPIISMYSPQAPFKIYTHEEWWADDWDAKTFGRDFDFNRPFFEQFQELLFSVPRFGIMNIQCVNCDYANFAKGAKNCYLVFGCVEDEDCAYGQIVWESKDSFDNLYIYKSELCYECVDCLGSYKLFYCQECENCNDSIGLYDCRGCSNCIGCVGLKQKSFHIFNENVGKEAYEKFLKEHPIKEKQTIQMILEKQMELRKKLPQRNFFGSHNTDVSGNHIYNGRRVYSSFDVKGGEDSKYVFTSRKSIDCHDIAFTVETEMEYEALTCVQGNRTFFSHLCYAGTDVFYSDSCFNSNSIFGCAGLKKSDYCILNKQYTKDEYFQMKEKIIEHMKKTGEFGEFFPPKLSPFAYNESVAQEYNPLTKEEAIKQGLRWKDDMPNAVGQETISNDALSQNPEEFSDEMAKHILKCDECGKNYRLIPKEIAFYKKIGVLLPRKCFNCRHQQRMKMRNKRKLWPGKCANCNADFQTSYSLEQQKEFRIFCESCYLKEMG